MKTVTQILKDKGTSIWSIPLGATVLDALQLMAEKNIGAVLVCEDNLIHGIFSERDYARKIVLAGKKSRETPIRDVMSSRVICVTPDRTLEECMAIMTEKRVRHIPVLDGERLIGVISIGDVVKGVISQQQFEIEQLHKYIRESR